MQQLLNSPLYAGQSDQGSTEKVLLALNGADRQNSNTVLLTLLTLVALSLLCNVDHGVLPAASIAIKADLSLNNLQYGMVGSSVFAGLTTGK